MLSRMPAAFELFSMFWQAISRGLPIQLVVFEGMVARAGKVLPAICLICTSWPSKGQEAPTLVPYPIKQGIFKRVRDSGAPYYIKHTVGQQMEPFKHSQ